MPRYEFDMTVTATRYVIYVVEADDKNEARKKAESGETESEDPGREVAVTDRTINSGPELLKDEEE